MVRSMRFHGAGQPLELVTLPVPELRDSEILVRMTACTLCRSDLHTHAGRRTEATPTVLGHEIVGRIEAFGPTVARADAAGVTANVGDRVTWAVVASCGKCFYCTAGLPQKCECSYKYGHERVTKERPLGGGLSDVVVLVPGTAWLRVPDEIPDQAAAPANCATATAAGLLRHAGAVAGQHVLVLGAGFLGVTLCAMARTAGAKAVMAADPDAALRERASAFGATHALAAEPTELATRVAEITHGRGADLVLEVAGVAASVQAGLTLVRTGGTVILAGTVAPVGHVGFEPERIVRRMLTVRGVHNYHPQDLQAALTFLAGPGRRFLFESLLAANYPLAEADQAFAHAHTVPGFRVGLFP
jgi:putative phosphonate catabolism associated alcohol dehydrogenase